jgi:preprotein translocase subunit YajC
LRTGSLSFQNLPPSPAEQKSSSTTVPQGSEAQGAPQPASPGGLGMLFPLLLLVPLLLMLFFSSRSQQKKQAAAIAGLKKGDRVLTQSGLVGKLVELGDRYAKVEIAAGVKVEILKTGLLGKDNAENAQAVTRSK